MALPSANGSAGRTKSTVRVSLDVSPDLNEKLETLAAQSHSSKSDVLRRALYLYSEAAEAKARGLKVGFAEPEQPLATEVIGF